MTETKTKSKTKSKDLFEDTIDQINDNTSEVFDLLSTVNNKVEKLGNDSLDESMNMLKSGQKVGKEVIKSTTDTASEAIKTAKSCIKGTLNLLKR